MPLANRATTTVKPTIHGAPCSIGKYYRDNLDDHAELAELNSLLYDEGKDAGQVWNELDANGITVARSTINKHRGGNCRCFTIDKDVCCPGCKRDFDHCVCGGKA